MTQNLQTIKVDLKQGSPEWLQWRQGGIGGSDAGAIMASSPYMDVIELYQRKLNLLPEITVNAAMQRGHDLEPIARVEFEMQEGISMAPGCYMHPEHHFMRASLDGISADGKTILEIKAPGLTTHREAIEGKVKPYYYTQMQHCLAVTGAEKCYYFSYTDLPDIKPTVLLTFERDEAYIERMIARETLFWMSVEQQIEPDIKMFSVGDAGTLNGDARTDPAWGKAVTELLTAQKVLEDAQMQYDIRLNRIGELMQRKKQMLARGSGVVVERVMEDGKWHIKVDAIEDEME